MGILTIHSNTKLSRKQREKRDLLLKQQREIKRSLKSSEVYTGETYNTRDTGKRYESKGDGIGNAVLDSPNKYTGDKVIGIATLHKSCLQPVFTNEQAVEVAHMRR